MPEALPDLAVFVVLLGALIFCYLVVYIAKALLGTAASATSWIPWVGTAVSGGLHKAEQHIVNVFSGAANGVQSAMGWSWHLQARLVDWLGREINSHANLIWLLANQIPGVGLVRSLLAAVHVAEREIGRLWKSIPGTAHGIAKPIEGELKALERWTYPRVKHAVNEVDHVIPKDIAGLRSRTKTIEGELGRLWKAIRANEAALATTAFVGAVALALSRLGMGWLRCNSATQLGKKYGCSLWSHLEQLLPLGILLTVAFDFPAFCKAANVVAIGIGDSVAAIEGTFDPQLEPLPPPQG
jgi:hypothetical protein